MKLLSGIRYISRVLDPEPVFDQKAIPFFRWIANYYLHGLGEVIATTLPRDYKGKSVRIYVAMEAGIDAIAADSIRSENQAKLLREIIAKPNRSSRSLQKNLSR